MELDAGGHEGLQNPAPGIPGARRVNGQPGGASDMMTRLYPVALLLTTTGPVAASEDLDVTMRMVDENETSRNPCRIRLPVPGFAGVTTDPW